MSTSQIGERFEAIKAEYTSSPSVRLMENKRRQGSAQRKSTANPFVPCSEWLLKVFGMMRDFGGDDGTRTRGLLRDRQAF